MAAPSGRRRGIPADRPRLWVNPCGGYISNSDESSAVLDMATPTDKEMLENIVIQDVNALAVVTAFKNEYVKEAFGVDFDLHHKSWEQYGYNWLFPRDKIPKSLHKPTETKHIENIELDSFLKDAYRLLQTMAVALEQVVWDHEYFRSDYKYVNSFNEIQYHLKAVLCEIQLVIMERDVNWAATYQNVTRAVMTEELRDEEDATKRKLRDWFIYRDFIIVLEYIKEVVQYFLDHPNKIPSS